MCRAGRGCVMLDFGGAIGHGILASSMITKSQNTIPFYAFTIPTLPHHPHLRKTHSPCLQTPSPWWSSPNFKIFLPSGTVDATFEMLGPPVTSVDPIFRPSFLNVTASFSVAVQATRRDQSLCMPREPSWVVKLSSSEGCHEAGKIE
jgi:hypothetical protein